MHKNKIYYLGIEDKNGKEITSNSIIKFKEHKGIVFYSIDDCKFKIKWEDAADMNIQESVWKKVKLSDAKSFVYKTADAAE